MAVLSAVSIAEIKARGSIKDADVLKVRRNYYDDGIITPEEADAIFALNDACPLLPPGRGRCGRQPRIWPTHVASETRRRRHSLQRGLQSRPINGSARCGG